MEGFRGNLWRGKPGQESPFQPPKNILTLAPSGHCPLSSGIIPLANSYDPIGFLDWIIKGVLRVLGVFGVLRGSIIFFAFILDKSAIRSINIKDMLSGKDSKEKR
jgi:hypothetical protein